MLRALLPMDMPAQPARPSHRRLIFGDFEVDLDRGSLACRGKDIPLRPKSFAMLQYLLEHAGELVSREELLAAVWPGAVVTDDSVAQCLIEIRKALGDDERAIIRTVPRRGLIFDLPVEAKGGTAWPPPPLSSWPARAWVLWFLPGGLAALLLWSMYSRESATAPDAATASTPPAYAIAVLRFTDMSPAGDHAYLAEGLSEEIMHRLAQSPTLRVIARASSFAVDGQSIAAIAEQLDVSHVLEGSVRRQGEDVRVTAQLVDAATAMHLWSKTYDRGMSDILELQQEIASDVASDLEISLAAGGPVEVIDPRAYALFLEGRHFYLRRSNGDLDRAQERYEAAVSISPEFARAWTGLSAVANVRLRGPDAPNLSEAERARHLESQRHATEQALRFGPRLPEAHIRAAYYYYFVGEKDRAREHVETARSIDPEHWLVNTALGNELRRAGRIDDTIRLFQREMQRDPLNLVLRDNLAFFLVWAGRFEEARVELEKTFEIVPSISQVSPTLLMNVQRVSILLGDFEAALSASESLPDNMERTQLLALAYHGLGRQSDSEAALVRINAAPPSALNSLYAAEIHAFRGENAMAMERLEKIELDRDCGGDRVITEPIYYSPFLRKLEGLPKWEEVRTGVLEIMKGCMLGLEIDSV